jgi:serine protease
MRQPPARKIGKIMKRHNINWALHLLAVILTFGSLPVAASAGGRADFIPQISSSALSNRVIVRLKPAQTLKGLSSAQIATDLRRPFSAATLNRLQTAAGVALAESHAISNGAHIIILQGIAGRQPLNRAIDNIRALSDVDYVEEDRILTTQAIPNDAGYGSLWGLQAVIPVASPVPGNSGSYGADFETAWNINSGISNSSATGIIVAVVDTGITPHLDIVGAGGTVAPASGNLVSPGYDFISDCRIRNTCAATTLDASAYMAPSANATDLGDFISTADSTNVASLFFGMTVKNSSWHGTHVSGTIAAIGNNNVGVIGGAYSARIVPVRALGKGGGYASDITEGVLWAAGVHPTLANPYPAKVINLSLGGAGACGTTEQDAINAATASGAVIVAAAGNKNEDVANHSPANCSNVISVAATGRDGLRAAYSNFSSPASNTTNPVKVTLAAPGGDKTLSIDPGILSTVNSSLTTPDLTATGSAYAYYQGTSMAAPHVTAAVALMRAHNPALTPAQVRSILPLSVTAFPSSTVWAYYDCATLKNCGTGILNAQFAVRNSVLPYSAATALAASKSSSGGSGGGCSIMATAVNPDISLLLTLLALLAYRFRLRLTSSFGKN